ncbi:hypothetical protein B932_0851 [Gluconobacter oxydans H24]|nr:hypothetical protein B932_0851 [Gluconobacter oxydans H24]
MKALAAALLMGLGASVMAETPRGLLRLIRTVRQDTPNI